MKTGWETKQLSDLCEFSRGLTYAKGDEVELSNNVVLRATNIDLMSNLLDFAELKYISDAVNVPDSKKVKRNSLIICTASGSKNHLGKVALVDDDYDYAFGGFMGMLTPKSDVLPKYLFHRMTSTDYKDFIGALSDGANINNLKFTDLGKFPIPVPPLPEQRRIVGILDEALAGLAIAEANAEKNLANARALFDNALNSAVVGQLSALPSSSDQESAVALLKDIGRARDAAVAEGRAKPIKTSVCLKDGLPRLPDGWTWTQLEALSVGISDGVHKKPNYTKSGVPFIKVNNLTAGSGISFDDVSYVSREDHEEFIKRTHPEKGDILISKDGTIGVVRLIETDIEFSLFVSVALVKPAVKELGPYLAYALSASSVQSQIVPQGAALKHLYLVDLRRLSIPLPPLSVQSLIVDRLDELRLETQRLESIYQRKVEALDELKKSLLHEAFSGNL